MTGLKRSAANWIRLLLLATTFLGAESFDPEVGLQEISLGVSGFASWILLWIPGFGFELLVSSAHFFSGFGSVCLALWLLARFLRTSKGFSPLLDFLFRSQPCTSR